MKRALIAGMMLAVAVSAAYGHGKKKHEDKAASIDMVETEFGMTGDPKNVTKTVNLGMSDEMQFSPDAITVKKGDTVRFVVKNNGETLHEMVIGRTEDLVKHAALMQKFPEMEHADPFMAHVEPGADGEIVWTFSKAGNFEFGCLIPGHFEAGMRGTIAVH